MADEKDKNEEGEMAVIELARRHLLPELTKEENSAIRGRMRSLDADGNKLIELLSETAKRKRVPRQKKMDLIRIKRRFRGFDDKRLLEKARKSDYPRTFTRRMRRLIRQKDGNDGEQSDLAGPTGNEPGQE